jgi:hypothetical protein
LGLEYISKVPEFIRVEIQSVANISHNLADKNSDLSANRVYQYRLTEWKPRSLLDYRVI